MAFQLVKAFLGSNKLSPNKRLVEVIVMSRNSPNTSLRIFNSISDYDLDITRAALSGGVCPAYRMNKLHWISVLLPDTREDVVRFLVNVSFEATKDKRKHRKE